MLIPTNLEEWPKGWPVQIVLNELVVDPTSPSGLRWLRGGRGKKADLVAGCLNKETGYWYVVLPTTKKLVACHRVIMYLSGIFPEASNCVVDHIDQDRANNRLENLRWVTYSENRLNCKWQRGILYPNYAFQYKIKGRNKFRAEYWNRFLGKSVDLGAFDDPYEAHLVAVAHRLETMWEL